MMCWRSNKKSGRRVKKSGRRHIFTSGLASSAPGPSFFALFWSILSYFIPNGLPIARDSWATGRGGQVRSRGTTSGSPDVTSSRIPRLRSHRVFCSVKFRSFVLNSVSFCLASLLKVCTGMRYQSHTRPFPALFASISTS